MFKLIATILLVVIVTLFYFARPGDERPHRVALPEKILPKIPGAYNHNVTQHSIGYTICVSGYTSRIRPSVDYTQALKKLQIKQLDYADTNIKHYEEDHLIPLELGGNPTSKKNLWPEPWYQADNSDPIENSLHRQVCNHEITLAGARANIKQYKLFYG